MSAKNSRGLGHYCTEILSRMGAESWSPWIAETGTMFKTALEPGETDLSARSTYAIAQFVRKHDGRTYGEFVSIDRDAGHIQVCQKALGSLSCYVTHIQAEGREGLLAAHWDFVLLDSDSDAEVTLREYAVAVPRMYPNGIMLIDDAFKAHGVNKFRLIREGPRPIWFDIGGIAAAIPFGPIAAKICSEVSNL